MGKEREGGAVCEREREREKGGREREYHVSRCYEKWSFNVLLS